jgi:predicted nucleic acid-binding protein
MEAEAQSNIRKVPISSRQVNQAQSNFRSGARMVELKNSIRKKSVETLLLGLKTSHSMSRSRRSKCQR